LSIYNKTPWFRSEFIGQTVEVLVEKVSKNRRNFQEEIHKVLRWFSKENYKIGSFVNVRITSAPAEL
jgi:tRNA A37 methylthiotransferase MiaB